MVFKILAAWYNVAQREIIKLIIFQNDRDENPQAGQSIVSISSPRIPPSLPQNHAHYFEFLSDITSIEPTAPIGDCAVTQLLSLYNNLSAKSSSSYSSPLPKAIGMQLAGSSWHA